SPREKRFCPGGRRSPAFTNSCVTIPETAQLMLMFSLLASTRPTAPTDDSNFAAGGADGGSSAWRTGFMVITAPTAKINVRTAINGTVFVMFRASCHRVTPYVWSTATRLSKLAQEPSLEPRSFGFPPRTQSGHHPYGRSGARNRKYEYHGSQ